MSEMERNEVEKVRNDIRNRERSRNGHLGVERKRRGWDERVEKVKSGSVEEEIAAYGKPRSRETPSDGKENSRSTTVEGETSDRNKIPEAGNAGEGKLSRQGGESNDDEENPLRVVGGEVVSGSNGTPRNGDAGGKRLFGPRKKLSNGEENSRREIKVKDHWRSDDWRGEPETFEEIEGNLGHARERTRAENDARKRNKGRRKIKLSRNRIWGRLR